MDVDAVKSLLDELENEGDDIMDSPIPASQSTCKPTGKAPVKQNQKSPAQQNKKRP